MTIRAFGGGTLWGVRTDIPNPTPVKFGTLQDVNLDISATNKELYGSGQFALAVGRGQVKVTGKAKVGQIQGSLLAGLYFGTNVGIGGALTANGEAQSVPATTPFTNVVANAASFVADLGVIYSLTGQALTLVASAPAVGQYSVNAATGTYTFNASDASAALLISYTYSQTGSTGQIITISQANQGVQPVFQTILETTYNDVSGLMKSVITLNACVSDKLSLPTKMGDWLISEFDFTAFANAAGIVGTIVTNRASN